MFEFDTAIASRRRIGLSLICVDSALLKSKLRAQFSEPCANITYHTSHASVLKVLSEGRKRLGFDQAWMPDSDFQRLGSRVVATARQQMLAAGLPSRFLAKF